jgi:hypothetical protein
LQFLKMPHAGGGIRSATDSEPRGHVRTILGKIGVIVMLGGGMMLSHFTFIERPVTVIVMLRSGLSVTDINILQNS